jgi:hypothetical protein
MRKRSQVMMRKSKLYRKNKKWNKQRHGRDGDVVSAGRGRIPSAVETFQAVVIACLQVVQAATDIVQVKSSWK